MAEVIIFFCILIFTFFEFLLLGYDRLTLYKKLFVVIIVFFIYLILTPLEVSTYTPILYNDSIVFIEPSDLAPTFEQKWVALSNTEKTLFFTTICMGCALISLLLFTTPS